MMVDNNEEEDAIMKNEFQDEGIEANRSIIDGRLRCWCFTSTILACISLFVVIPIVVTTTAPGKTGDKHLPFGSFNSVWYPLGNKLTGFEGGEEFGESIDLSGDGLYLAIGSNSKGIEQGKVEVLMYSGTDWRQMGNVIEGEFKGENFGHCVQLSSDGDILTASGPGTRLDLSDSDSQGQQGSVRSYTYHGELQKWIQFGNEISGQRPVKGDRFGTSLSMASDGRSYVVGTDNPDLSVENCCYAMVYELSRFGSWIQKGDAIQGARRPTQTSITDGLSQGFETAMSGDGSTVCVGDHWFQGVGRVRCYKWKTKDFFGDDPDSWLPTGDAIPGTVPNGQFGYSLSLNYDGTRVAIGNRIRGKSTNLKDGRVGVYQFHNDKRKWTLIGSEQTSTQNDDQGGFAVKLNKKGNVLAWSIPGFDHDDDKSDVTKKDAGMVRILYWSDSDNDWLPLASNEAVLGDSENDYFGESIALSDDGTIFASSSISNDVEYVNAYALV